MNSWVFLTFGLFSSAWCTPQGYEYPEPSYLPPTKACALSTETQTTTHLESITRETLESRKVTETKFWTTTSLNQKFEMMTKVKTVHTEITQPITSVFDTVINEYKTNIETQTMTQSPVKEIICLTETDYITSTMYSSVLQTETEIIRIPVTFTNTKTELSYSTITKIENSLKTQYSTVPGKDITSTISDTRFTTVYTETQAPAVTSLVTTTQYVKLTETQTVNPNAITKLKIIEIETPVITTTFLTRVITTWEFETVTQTLPKTNFITEFVTDVVTSDLLSAHSTVKRKMVHLTTTMNKPIAVTETIINTHYENPDPVEETIYEMKTRIVPIKMQNIMTYSTLEHTAEANSIYYETIDALHHVSETKTITVPCSKIERNYKNPSLSSYQ